MFHKSHSRKDIIDIVKIFKIPLEDPEDFNKKDLSNKLHTILYDVIDGIIPDEHYYGIKNLHDLKEYLINPHSNERIFPIISKKIQRDLEIKELTSKTIHHSLTIRIEKIILSFD